MTITPEEIARLRALEAKATPGPVTATKQAIKHSSVDDAGRRVTAFVAACISATLPNEANASLLAESRNALPRLLDEIERLRADLREAVALLRYCGDWRSEPLEDVARRDALLAKHKEDS